MIKNIIFDFGDVFINLDKQAVFRQLKKFGGEKIVSPEMIALNNAFEIGAMTTESFIDGMSSLIPAMDSEELVRIWNSMLLDFPDERLQFIENLANEGTYRLFLLSNTNALHIPHVEKIIGSEKFQRFKNAFEQFYLSHEIKMRKPNAEIYRFVLDENRLNAQETFFIDDTKENVEAAEKLGIQCWHLNVGQDDIVELKDKL
ncbi:HAD family hydrolase [Pareuzebyella sediminis]|uniref:HAD family hydrolase n=1 Tax=Pareuzebyella sediminis TaxID=2607998 RepID=UPI0011EF8E2F|nr:HAD family phosphatase [Pareuzebyella sediminis]